MTGLRRCFFAAGSVSDMSFYFKPLSKANDTSQRKRHCSRVVAKKVSGDRIEGGKWGASGVQKSSARTRLPTITQFQPRIHILSAQPPFEHDFCRTYWIAMRDSKVIFHIRELSCDLDLACVRRPGHCRERHQKRRERPVGLDIYLNKHRQPFQSELVYHSTERCG